MIQRLKQFVAAVYSWKLNLLLERSYYMSLQFEALTAAVDKLAAVMQSFKDSVTAAEADRDKAVAALADAEAKAATDQASAQAQIDALTEKLTGVA